MSVKIAGNTSGNIAEVDNNNNLKVSLTTASTQAGFVIIQSQNDTGLYIAGNAKDLKSPMTTLDYRLKVGMDTPLFNEFFIGAALNSAQWNSTVSTMTTSVSGGFLNLNNGASTASGAVARVQSYRQIPFYGNAPLYLEFLIQLAFTPVANNVCEWGIGYATTTTAPTDGVYFRLNTSGNLECVVNNNGSETVTTVTSSVFPFAANTTYHCILYITEDAVNFIINYNTLASIPRGAAGTLPSSSNELPILTRTYNSASTGSAQQLKIALITAYTGDALTSKPWPHIMCGTGQMGYQGQDANTMGSTALYTNSLASGAGAVMTNTTAALGTGLGGQFSALPTLAVGTDGIMCSYQNPTGTAAVPAKTLYITGVRIQGAITTVFVGNLTPVVYAYSLAFGHTAVSMATAEAATTKAPRRISLGFESYPAVASAGTIGSSVSMIFNSPVVVNPAEFVAVCAKNVGAVTTTGVITFLVAFDCYWE